MTEREKVVSIVSSTEQVNVEHLEARKEHSGMGDLMKRVMFFMTLIRKIT